jgi:hypothetical protein
MQNIINENWLPEKLVSYKFLMVATLLFPVVLVLAASFQPRMFFDQETLWYKYSASIFYLHWIIFSVLTLFFICKYGGLKFSDIGLKSSQALSLLWIPPIIWIAEQIVLSVLIPFGLAEFRLNEVWLTQATATRSISSFFANLLATGINEETFFRGFVFAQLYRRFGGEAANKSLQLKPFIITTLIASVIFAVMHLQVRPAVLLILMLGGIIGCLVYIRTRNLFVGISLHGVFNSPMPLLETGEVTAKIVVIALMLIFALIYPHLERISPPADAKIAER